MGEQFEVGLPKPNEAAPPSLQHQSAPVEREWRVEPRNDWAAPKDNGWVLSHDAIRADLEDTMQVVARLAAAAAVEAWEHEYLVAWWARVAEYIIHHHRHEEECARARPHGAAGIAAAGELGRARVRSPSRRPPARPCDLAASSSPRCRSALRSSIT